MQKEKKNYNAVDLAKMFGIHSNTVRLYEKLGFISHAKRNSNNYRMFEELHVLQIKTCRCIFGYPFTTRRIRSAGNKILQAIAMKQWDPAWQYTDCYIKVIEQEIRTAQAAAEMLRNWADPNSDKGVSLEKSELSRKEAADYLGVTVEAVRNWERNGLINPYRTGKRGETLYSGADLGRMCIVYMLLQSGYSVASIHRSISMYDKGYPQLVLPVLNNPEHDDLISVGDHWFYELVKLKEAAQKIHPIIGELKKL